MEAYIYDILRTVRGKGNKKGGLLITTPTALSVQVMEELRLRNNLDTKLIEELIIGCVTQIMDQGANIGKTIAQQSKYGDHLCAYTINRFCGSGLEAVNQSAAYVKSGYKNIVIAGGVESMSRVPMGSDGGAMAADPSVALPGMFVPQGISADLIATKYGYSRTDADAFALVSQKRAKAAEVSGYFSKSRISIKDVNGITLLDTDENIRDTDKETLSQLPLSFDKLGFFGGFDAVALDRYPEMAEINHIHHAGNSSGIVDGAALAIIGNEQGGRDLGLKPRARIKTMAVWGTDPTIMLTGPIPASKKALKKRGWEYKTSICLK